MATADYHSDEFVRQLNEFDIELRTFKTAFDHVYYTMDLEEPFCSLLHLLQEKLDALAKSVPFPPQITPTDAG